MAINRDWVQPPTRALCVEQCRGACCRAPGSLTLSMDEVQRLAAHPKRQPWALVLRGMPGEGSQTLNFSENGGQCPMLAQDSSCSVYDDRPIACRRYPEAPHARCAVWPRR